MQAKARRTWGSSLAYIGAFVRIRLQYVTDLLGLFSLTLYQIPNLRQQERRQVFWLLFKRQLYNTGFKAVYVNCAIAMFLGIAFADQVTAYLQKVENFADLFVLFVVREIAPLISGIILIARSATAVTAEIGYLKLNDEFEVLEAQSVNPIFMFILPIFFAFPCSLLIMLVYFNTVTLLASWFYLEMFTLTDWQWNSFLYAITDRLTFGEILITAGKAMVGGVIIGLVCLQAGSSVGDRFTDVPRTISNSTTSLLFAYFAICVGLSLVAY